MFGASEQFEYDYYNVIPVSEDMRGHVLFLSSSRSMSLGGWIGPKNIHLNC